MTRIKSKLSSVFRKKLPQPEPVTQRSLISRESAIGADIFGPIPKNHRREFFCLDNNTWVWHEEWTDANFHKFSTTIRYEIHAKGILKVQEGHPYEFVEGQELHNLVWAMHLYYERIAREIYGRNPQTAQRIQKATA